MRGEDIQQSELFSYGSLDERVPEAFVASHSGDGRSGLAPLEDQARPVADRTIAVAERIRERRIGWLADAGIAPRPPLTLKARPCSIAETLRFIRAQRRTEAA
jgi:hypothetical protein